MRRKGGGLKQSQSLPAIMAATAVGAAPRSPSFLPAGLTYRGDAGMCNYVDPSTFSQDDDPHLLSYCAL